MSSRATTTARLLVTTALAAGLLVLAGTVTNAQEGDELYPLPGETPVTEVAPDVRERPVTDVAPDVQERPETQVLPGDLAVTGFDISAPLALGALLLLVGGGILAADRWYKRRQERYVTG
jgi:hypothetical protein